MGWLDSGELHGQVERSEAELALRERLDPRRRANAAWSVRLRLGNGGFFGDDHPVINGVAIDHIPYRNGVFLGRIIHKWWTFQTAVFGLEGRSAQN